MAGEVSVVREMALKCEANGLGYGFAIGERYTTTLVYRSQDEARAARKKVMDAVGSAVEAIERWAPEKR